MSYLDTLGVCACGMNGDGFLGWFYNLAECERRYPSASMGMSFVNVETRSLWVYDGVAWCNTTQGSPYTMITDVNNVGVVKKGYARTFYYIPNEEDVNGGTITFHFLIDGKDMWVECDVHYTSDIVLIEWNGSDFVSRVRSLDERVAYVEDGKVVDGSGNVVVNPAVIQSGIKVSVQYVPQSKSSDEQMQARKNIGAIGVSTMSNGTAVLESNGQTIYPYVPASKIPTTNGKSIEQRVADEESRAQSAEEELAENLSILQGNTQSAASELDRRISEEQRRAESAEKDIAEDLSLLSQDYGAFKNALPDYIRERIEDVIGDIDINGEDGKVYVWEPANFVLNSTFSVSGDYSGIKNSKIVILDLGTARYISAPITIDASGNITLNFVSHTATGMQIITALISTDAKCTTSASSVTFPTLDEKESWSGKQAKLVSGTNIKTINNQSLLGSGNITVATREYVDGKIGNINTILESIIDG